MATESKGDVGLDKSVTNVDESSHQTTTLHDHSTGNHTEVRVRSGKNSTLNIGTQGTSSRHPFLEQLYWFAGITLPLITIAGYFGFNSSNTPRAEPSGSQPSQTPKSGDPNPGPSPAPPVAGMTPSPPPGPYKPPQARPHATLEPGQSAQPTRDTMVQSGDRDLIGAYARGHVLVSGIGLPMFQAPNLEIAYRSALDAAELDARSSLLALFESEIKRLVSNEHYRSLLKVTERSEGTVPPGRRVKETPPDVFARAQSSSPSVDIVMRFELFGPNGVLTPLVQQVAPQLMLSERGVAQFGDASNQSDVDGLILVVPASLQPTPFPRVFTSAGELVYGVRDVDPGILSSAGLASFARSVDDAERKLRERGVLKPRVLQASLRNAIELVVTPQVARDMVAADRGAAVFRNARVCVAISR